MKDNYVFQENQNETDTMTEVGRVALSADWLLFGVYIKGWAFFHDEVDKVCNQLFWDQEVIKLLYLKWAWNQPFK